MPMKIMADRAPALLVDDHPDVLVSVGAFLDAAGFEVVRAHSGDEALAWLGSGQTFALLVTDYAMPGMDGADLAKQAVELLPGLKVLIITGYPSDAGLFDRPPGVALLAKPFRRTALIAMLQSMFAAGQTGLPTSPE